MNFIGLPAELIRYYLLQLDDSLIYFNLIQANTLFLDILSENDKEHIKYNFCTYVHNVTDLGIKYQGIHTDKIGTYFYTLPNGYLHGNYVRYNLSHGYILHTIYYKDNDVLSGKYYLKTGKLDFEYENIYIGDGKRRFIIRNNRNIITTIKYFTLDTNRCIETHRYYNNDGILQSKRNYNNKLYYCVCKKYHLDGNIKSKEYFRDSQDNLHSHKVKYRPDRSIKSEGDKNGPNKVGTWITY